MQKEIKHLLQSENINGLDFLNRIVEDMPGGFFICRADETEAVIYANKPLLKIFGCENHEEFAELTGNTFRGMIHPDDVDEVETIIAERIRSSKDKFGYVECRIKQKDGSTRWICDYGHYVRLDSSGAFFYVFVIDNTDQMKKRMSELECVNRDLMQISIREMQYRKAILHDAAFFCEVNLSEDRILLAVPQTKVGRMFDFFNRLQENDSISYSDYISSANDHINSDEYEAYRDFFSKDRLIDCCKYGILEQCAEFNAVDVLGRKRLLQYIVLLGDGDEVFALIMAHDATEKDEHRRILNDSLQRAQAASAAKSEFLASMSHDIRTPLNAILGCSDLLRINLGNDSLCSEYIQKINTSGKQLLAILDESLEITRTKSGKIDLAEMECRLDELLSDTERIAASEMKAKNITFTVDKSGISHPCVLADYVRLKEILCQILDNAAKYTHNNGRVDFTITEETQNDGFGKYVFTVRDNGIGMSREFLEHMFDPFTREKNTTESGIFGSGLGMSVVKGLVELMNGGIDVESEPGEGSCFKVSLVLKQLDGNMASEDPPHKEISLEGRRILLVEDNEINREIAEALLAEEGFVIETAEDGDVGVDMVKNSSAGYYDLVLMDIQMPRMNGYDATRKIRGLGDSKLANIPIIALSANTYAEDRKRSIDAGMDAHAPKPIDMEGLVELIQSVLERKG